MSNLNDTSLMVILNLILIHKISSDDLHCYIVCCCCTWIFSSETGNQYTGYQSLRSILSFLYRKVALSVVQSPGVIVDCCKVVLVFDKYRDNLTKSDLQFGLKSKRSTITRVYCLRGNFVVLSINQYSFNERHVKTQANTCMIYN